MAEVGGTIKVTGNKIATPLIEPNPGIAPMKRPTVTPATVTAKFIGWSEIAKPFKRRSSVSMSACASQLFCRQFP
jgi:hypothetical protein